MDEYDRKYRKSDADWEAVDIILIEKIGRAQRDVPAHIAHEYCHRNRSFENVSKNKELLNPTNPDNLKQPLKFFNYDTGDFDVWFSRDSYRGDSGLGFSFGILRGIVLAGPHGGF